MKSSHKEIGLIINPISGMGGKVALKGTDGEKVLIEAIARGAVPEANDKMERALQVLERYKNSVLIYTASGSMGQGLCEKMGFFYQLPYLFNHTKTTSEDTKQAAKSIVEAGAELILFAGGDGTARDICEVVGDSIPVLGIPTGVKIQSAVFALSPENAGTIAAQFARGIPMTISKREVVDLDEDVYRTGNVSAKLYGVMSVPDVPELLQSMKQSGFSTEADQMNAIAVYLKDHMLPDVYYAIGPGTCAKCLSRELNIEYELLGVDIIQNGVLIQKDVTEEQLWHYAKEEKLRIIVSPIGGQGFVFGRGNHQFSARVLQAVGKEGIQIISPESKLLSIADRILHIDCGDAEINKMLRGYYRVLCGYRYFSLLECK